jgi:hypothetical protein
MKKMKKLNKLSINPEKIMKNQELINLQGGGQPYGSHGSWCCWCGGYTMMGGVSTYDSCQSHCSEAYNAYGYWYC